MPGPSGAFKRSAKRKQDLFKSGSDQKQLKLVGLFSTAVHNDASSSESNALAASGSFTDDIESETVEQKSGIEITSNTATATRPTDSAIDRGSGSIEANNRLIVDLLLLLEHR